MCAAQEDVSQFAQGLVNAKKTCAIETNNVALVIEKAYFLFSFFFHEWRIYDIL